MTQNFFFRFIFGVVVGWIFWSLAFWTFGEKFSADQWGVIALLALIMGVVNAVVDC